MNEYIKKSDVELKVLANELSKNITIRGYDKIGVKCHDIKRKTTSAEAKIIYNIAYGSLLTYNHCDYKEKKEMMAIVDAAEYILNLFIPECNGYETLYNPLRKIMEK